MPRGLLGPLPVCLACSRRLRWRAAKAAIAELLRSLSRVDLLVLDNWGPSRSNADQRRDLLEIVEYRYDARSILITSQAPIKNWYDIFGNPRSPTPLSIASSTTHTASNSAAIACAE